MPSLGRDTVKLGLNLIKEWLDSENLPWRDAPWSDHVVIVKFEGIEFIVQFTHTTCLQICPIGSWPGYKGTGRIDLSNPTCFDSTYQYMVKWLTDHLKSTEGMVDHRSIYQET